MAKVIRQKIMIKGQVRWISGKTQQAIVNRAIELYQQGTEGTEQDETNTNIPFFGEYAKDWLQNYKIPKLKHTTITTYRNLLDKHILPFFGTYHICVVDTTMIQQFYTAKAYLSNSTEKQMGIVLRQIFNSAIEDGYIIRNPTNSKRLTISKRVSKRKALSADAFYEILASLYRLRAGDRVFVAILMFTGIRRGEAIGLRWEDINTTDQLVYIRRSVTFHNNQPVIGSPKSAAGIRIVPLDKRLQTILLPHWGEGYAVGNGVTPMTESTFSRTWERIGKTIDLHDATPHILRHTYITLASTVIDIKTLQAIAGHADIQTTMNRYAHPQTDKIVEAGRILERVFPGV